MKPSDLLIVLGELREFKRNTLYEIKELRAEVKALNKFKWRLVGASGVAVFLSTIVVELVRR